MKVSTILTPKQLKCQQLQLQRNQKKKKNNNNIAYYRILSLLASLHVYTNPSRLPACCTSNQESISSNITTPLERRGAKVSTKMLTTHNLCLELLFAVCRLPFAVLFVIAAACCATIMLPQVVVVLLSFLLLFGK